MTDFPVDMVDLSVPQLLTGRFGTREWRERLAVV